MKLKMTSVTTIVVQLRNHAVSMKGLFTGQSFRRYGSTKENSACVVHSTLAMVFELCRRLSYRSRIPARQGLLIQLRLPFDLPVTPK
ncbi:MAG TPA: hypothetical protein VHI52_09385 [Verrucomicrobiae bacterium]|nr:hypothetical protein [Verrucomicrobiae bacterium]